MEERFIEIIEKIIELIESDKSKAYAYSNNKFHIIDKDNNIDFQAKLCNNNYYFKDNINNLTYIKTIKYLDSDTTIQQILLEEGNEKCYYSFLERDSYTSLARMIRVNNEESLVCTNTEIVNHTWKEILDYANTIFEPVFDGYDFDDPDDMDNIEHFETYYDMMESKSKETLEEMKEDLNYDNDHDDYDDYDDNDFEDYDSDYDYDEESEDMDELDDIDDSEDLEDFDDFPEDYEEDDYEYEFNQLTGTRETDIVQDFEKISITAYEKLIGQEIEEEKQTDRIKNYTEAVKQYYDKYKICINKKEVDGEAKCIIATDCDSIIGEKCYDSIELDESVENLRVVIESKLKKEELEK